MRIEDWEVALSEHIELSMAQSGRIGESDCIICALQAADKVTGKSYTDLVIGKYSSLADARKLMVKEGFKSLESALASRFKPKNKFNAMRGDIGIVERDGIESCGFYTEYGFAVKTEYGLSFLSIDEVKIAFEVS